VKSVTEVLGFPVKNGRAEKTKTRLVRHEDDKRVAVPPQFAVLYGALCNRLQSVHAVTGNPVPVYLPGAFFGIEFRRLQHCFPVDASTKHILLYQVSERILLLNSWDYTFL